MKKILVTTDFSANSKKAIRFAMQLASQNNYKLVFYNITSIMIKPTIWDNVYYGNYESNQISKNQEKLENLITKIHQETGLPVINYECVCEIIENPLMDVSKQIMKYAAKCTANYICVSTRGSGTIDKLFGTVASSLILKSTIPMFIIPKNYKISKFNTICYASDIENIDSEIKKVIEFSDSVKAKLTVLHYDFELYLKLENDKLNKLAKKYDSENIKFQCEKLNAKYTLNYHIRKDVMLLKPSLVVLFTKQNRKWFDRIFATHHTTNMSFNTKVPLLIFRKKN